MMSYFVLVLAAFIGVLLGLLGGGGSILTIPMLVFATDLPADQAIATSLLLVAVTSAVALIAHARAQRVHWRSGFLFGGASMLTAFAAGHFAQKVPQDFLLTLFAVIMAITGLAMVRPGWIAPRVAARSFDTATKSDPPACYRVPPRKFMVYGSLLGCVTGLVGAGGGFMIVPIFVLACGLPMQNAAATSLLVITLNTTAGLLGHITHVHMPWAFAIPITGAAILGSIVGSLLSLRVPQARLRIAFGGLVIFTAACMLLREFFKLFT